MPEISRFHGIKIRMHFGSREHPPPHFHARSNTGRALVALDGTILEGFMPANQAALIREWALLHHAELQTNWDRCNNNEPPLKVAPLK